jgi:hypothetical protein
MAECRERQVNGMANEEHLRILLSGVAAWNEWRTANPNVLPLLRGVSLERADLNHVNLNGANLNDAILNDANLSDAGLADAKLIGADLNSATLIAAKLSGANLIAARLNAANLRNADLTDALIKESSLSLTEMAGSVVAATAFVGVSLGKIIGLPLVKHLGPSYISVDTLEQTAADLGTTELSKQHDVELFLEGAGVPKEYIDFFRSRIGQPIQFYSCFISYSTKDQDFADRLYADLRSRNIRCWFAPHDLKPGRKIHEEIDAAIRVYDKLVLILSPDSMNSEWVNTEIASARRREVREKRRMLFPIRLVHFDRLRDWQCFDADTGKDSAREIREYYVPDFSTWKTDHDAYKRELEKIVAALEANDEPKRRRMS